MLSIYQQIIIVAMKFFIDTADIDEIKSLNNTGMVDGVTTNPSLIAKSGQSILDVIEQICQVVDGPVSAEVIATDVDNMLKEGRKLASISKSVAVKVPLTHDGLMACKALSNENIMVNVTLCFSAAQAILAAKAGATFVSPFIGRLDDIGQDGLNLISDICTIYSNYPLIGTQVLVASVRGPQHVIESAKIGADVVTIPPSILRQLFKHPLTDNGLKAFMDDWARTGQSILL